MRQQIEGDHIYLHQVKVACLTISRTEEEFPKHWNRILIKLFHQDTTKQSLNLITATSLTKSYLIGSPTEEEACSGVKFVNEQQE